MAVSGTQFNLFCVKDFQEILPSGHPVHKVEQGFFGSEAPFSPLFGDIEGGSSRGSGEMKGFLTLREAESVERLTKGKESFNISNSSSF